MGAWRVWLLPLSVALLVSVALLLSACSPGVSSQRPGLVAFEQYYPRLIRVLDLQVGEDHQEVGVKGPVVPSMGYPVRRELQLTFPPSSINLLDFLRLSPCELQRLLGERNSSLGKFMADSQQLLYHRRFLQLAPLCLDQLRLREASPELTAALELAIEQKHQQTPGVYWNATFGSAEFQTLMSAAGGPLQQTGELQTPAELWQSLERMRAVLKGKAVDSSALESIYQIIGSGPRGGRLLASQYRATQLLESLTAAVRSRLGRRALCLKQSPTPEARAVQQVMLKFYIGEAQPYLSAVHRQSREFQRQIQGLLQSPELSEPPLSFRAYWHSNWDDTHPGSVWSRYQQAVASHTRMWQELLSSCGLSPGNPPN